MSTADFTDVNPYSSPTDAPVVDNPSANLSSPSIVSAKNRILLETLFLPGIVCVPLGFAIDVTAIQLVARLVTGLIVAVQVYRWMQLDCQQRGVSQFSSVIILALIFLPGPGVTMAIYFLSSRGLRGFLSILKGIGCLFVLMLVCAVGGALGAFFSTI